MLQHIAWEILCWLRQFSPRFLFHCTIYQVWCVPSNAKSWYNGYLKQNVFLSLLWSVWLKQWCNHVCANNTPIFYSLQSSRDILLCSACIEKGETFLEYVLCGIYVLYGVCSILYVSFRCISNMILLFAKTSKLVWTELLFDQCALNIPPE